jgi:hypothetical protein
MKENKRDDDHANYGPEVEQLGRKDSCKSKAMGGQHGYSMEG